MIKIEVLTNLNKVDRDRILQVWESSVRPSYTFLSEEDIEAIKPQVLEAVKEVSTLFCVRNEEGDIEAFMGVEERKIEMLFVENKKRARGIGKSLVAYAIEELDVKYVDVNEENTAALGFYEHMGFKSIKRSKLDANKDPFPILTMMIK